MAGHGASQAPGGGSGRCGAGVGHGLAPWGGRWPRSTGRAGFVPASPTGPAAARRRHEGHGRPWLRGLGASCQQRARQMGGVGPRDSWHRWLPWGAGGGRDPRAGAGSAGGVWQCPYVLGTAPVPGDTPQHPPAVPEGFLLFPPRSGCIPPSTSSLLRVRETPRGSFGALEHCRARPPMC